MSIKFGRKWQSSGRERYCGNCGRDSRARKAGSSMESSMRHLALQHGTIASDGFARSRAPHNQGSIHDVTTGGGRSY